MPIEQSRDHVKKCLALEGKKQKQQPRGVLSKRCSESMQQIYRRTPMSKCDFNKVANLTATVV